MTYQKFQQRLVVEKKVPFPPKLRVPAINDTVDGRNPAPPGMYKTPVVNNGINYLSTGAGFLPTVPPWMENSFYYNLLWLETKVSIDSQAKLAGGHFCGWHLASAVFFWYFLGLEKDENSSPGVQQS